RSPLRLPHGRRRPGGQSPLRCDPVAEAPTAATLLKWLVEQPSHKPQSFVQRPAPISSHAAANPVTFFAGKPQALTCSLQLAIGERLRAPKTMPGEKWDVFVSYASEDRLAVAVPLRQALEKQGLRVWLDRGELTVGDGLREKINEGLSQSRFAVVVVSRASLAKQWPRDEWSAVLALESAGQRRLLPVMFDVSPQEV